jgi:hypothetical protein
MFLEMKTSTLSWTLIKYELRERFSISEKVWVTQRHIRIVQQWLYKTNSQQNKRLSEIISLVIIMVVSILISQKKSITLYSYTLYSFLQWSVFFHIARYFLMWCTGGDDLVK